MIINFSIRNFGSIKDIQTLSFEADKTTHLEDFYVAKIGKYRLLKLALIYGANASGKTMILKALDFLRDLVLEPAAKKTEKLDFQPFLFDENTPHEDSVLSIEFLHNETKYYYEVAFNQTAVTNEILNYYAPKKATVFKRTTDLEKQFSKITFGNKFKIDRISLKTLEANTLWNNTVLGGYLKTNVEIDVLREVTNWFKAILFPVIYPHSNLENLITSLIDKKIIRKENVLAVLRKADLNISNILIEKVEEENLLYQYIEKPPKRKAKILAEFDFEHFVKGKKYSLPFKLESQGTKRYYTFAGLLNLLIKGSFVLPIDELGASLHPDLYQHFLLTFLANSKSSQIVATTHNREILNDKDLIRDDVLWITDKSEEAATELYSFADFDTSVIRDTTNRLNAYKSGKLGGIPNVGDYYLDID